MLSFTTTLAFTLIATAVWAEPNLDFVYDRDTIIPGVRTVPRGRELRTPSPPFLDSPIFFPGGGIGGQGNPAAVRPVQPHITSFNNRRTPPNRPVPESALTLSTNISELDVTSLGKLNAIADMSDFARLFNLSLPTEDRTGAFAISERFGGSGNENGETFEMANCKPELVTVPLDLPVEANTLFFPTCIRLEQCGGCCFGPLLTCRPSVTKIVKVKVLKINSAASGRSSGRNRRQNTSSYHVVEAVKHTACECGCRVREEDCNSDLHTYYEGECSCVCKNKDEKEKCEQQNTTKYWDNDSCSCYCRKPLNCGTGEYFSQASCSCERLVARGGFIAPGREAVRYPYLVTPRPRRPRPVRVPINREA